ncbi:MAG: DUF2147 domain-containing protein [Candidatus Competibacteraceae bacterium]|nr:DUF2147 domain-containing protein [Candidatus Competibacteraceae bacterium]
MKKSLFFFLIFISGSIWSQGIDNPDLILGTWIPKDGKSHVKIEKIGNKYFGKVVWLKEPLDKETGKPPLDKKNPDQQLRNQPIMGLRIMKDFTYTGKGIFKEGRVYDPNDGKTYCGKITIISDDEIDLRGSICGFSILGRTETWKRHKP